MSPIFRFLSMTAFLCLISKASFASFKPLISGQSAEHSTCFANFASIIDPDVRFKAISQSYLNFFTTIGGEFTPEQLQLIVKSGDPFKVPRGLGTNSDTLRSSMAELETILSESDRTDKKLKQRLIADLQDYIQKQNRQNKVQDKNMVDASILTDPIEFPLPQGCSTLNSIPTNDGKLIFTHTSSSPMYFYDYDNNSNTVVVPQHAKTGIGAQESATLTPDGRSILSIIKVAGSAQLYRGRLKGLQAKDWEPIDLGTMRVVGEFGRLFNTHSSENFMIRRPSEILRINLKSKSVEKFPTPIELQSNHILQVNPNNPNEIGMLREGEFDLWDISKQNSRVNIFMENGEDSLQHFSFSKDSSKIVFFKKTEMLILKLSDRHISRFPYPRQSIFKGVHHGSPNVMQILGDHAYAIIQISDSQRKISLLPVDLETLEFQKPHPLPSLDREGILSTSPNRKILLITGRSKYLLIPSPILTAP